MKFTIAGGDSRNLTLGNILAHNGYEVEYMALGEDVFTPVYTDYVIGPIPFTSDGENINAPLSKQTIKCKAFTDSIMNARALIAGKIPETAKKELEEKGIRTYDYLDREEMAILNSIPTAEGAISVAMQELDVTLHGAKARPHDRVHLASAPCAGLCVCDEPPLRRPPRILRRQLPGRFPCGEDQRGALGGPVPVQPHGTDRRAFRTAAEY